MELQKIAQRKQWTERVKEARVRLLNECKAVNINSPIAKVVFMNNIGTEKIWEGRTIPGYNFSRGTWLSRAEQDQKDLAKQ